MRLPRAIAYEHHALDRAQSAKTVRASRDVRPCCELHITSNEYVARGRFNARGGYCLGRNVRLAPRRNLKFAASRSVGENRGLASTRLRRLLGGTLAVLVLLTGMVSLGPGLTSPAAQATPIHVPASSAAPTLYKYLAFANRIDDEVDELRADIVLKVPVGWVDPDSGELLWNEGKQLRLGYDYTPVNPQWKLRTVKNLTYINTMSNGAQGAHNWARNKDQGFTIHKVLESGSFDYLVISVEGDMDILPNLNSAFNQPDGVPSTMNMYFDYSAKSDTTWIKYTRTTETIDYRAHLGHYGIEHNSKRINGPRIQMLWDDISGLWSDKQANWGQVLDFEGALGNKGGTNKIGSMPEGVLPPNSIAIDLINTATYSTIGTDFNYEKGPTGSVSESFWYAWVHEDGSLVTSINTGPIRVTGGIPRTKRNSHKDQLVRNCAPGQGISTYTSGPYNWDCVANKRGLTMAWTQEQADQGLTSKVAASGAIDFTDAGGTGFYRLAVWPESRNPATITGDHGAPIYQYTAADLVQNNQLTQRGQDMAWVGGTVFYKYGLPKPEAPHIDDPVDGWVTNTGTPFTVHGTGSPGHTITLKMLKSHNPLTQYNDPALTTLVDGEHERVASDVVVQPDGTWSFEIEPKAEWGDGKYTLVAAQTEQISGFQFTSPMSNPDDATAPTRWGVRMEIDRKAPTGASLTCPAQPITELPFTLKGGGVTADVKKVLVYQKPKGGTSALLGEATIAGSGASRTWSYVVAGPLDQGKVEFTVTAVDAAGNESEPSKPACEVLILTPIAAAGTKIVVPVQYGNPALGSAAVDNWEITLTEGTKTSVLNNGSKVEIEPGKSYTVGERLRTAKAPDADAAAHIQLGDTVCTDGAGVPLPVAVFDPSTDVLKIDDSGAQGAIAAPISCAVTNQTAHVSYVTKRVGGQVTLPLADWDLTLAGSGAAPKAALSNKLSSSVARPAEYQLAAKVPDDFRIIAIEQLKLSDASCAVQALDPVTISDSCWESAGTGTTASAKLSQGKHSVFRVVAAAPADVPPLPMTGGLGSWQFQVAGGGALLAAAVFTVFWLRRRNLAVTAM